MPVRANCANGHYHFIWSNLICAAAPITIITCSVEIQHDSKGPASSGQSKSLDQPDGQIQLLIPCRYKDFAIAVGLHGRDKARAFHLLNQTRRPVITDSKMPLHQRDRSAPRLEHHRDGLVVKRISFPGSLPGHATILISATLFFQCVQHAIHVARFAMIFQIIHHAMNFLISNEGTMNPLRVPASWRQIEHVALAQQRLRPHLIEDGTGIHLARYLERDPRRNIGLDKTRNYVD